MISRRVFIQTTACAVGSGLAVAPAYAEPVTLADVSARIVELLAPFPGRKGFVIRTALNGNKTEISRGSESPYAVGSCFKVFTLVTFLRMVENGKASLDEMLPLDRSVMMPGSFALTPSLRGTLKADIACQEMIAYSDNTATDMLMKRVGPQNVRSLIKSIGLGTIRIPDSTRQLFVTSAGYPPNFDPSYAQLFEGARIGAKAGAVQPPVGTPGASSGSLREYARFYERALAGEFFRSAKTMSAFGKFMHSGGLLEKSIPSGSIAYTKGGSYQYDKYCGVATAGVMNTLNNSIAYAFGLNWIDPKSTPVTYDAMLERFFEAQKKALAIAREAALAA